VNATAYAELPDDLKQAVSYACESLYNPVWTEYTTKHAQALKQMVENEGVQVRMLPDDVVAAMADAAAEVMAELAEDDDELVRRITASFTAYRDSVGSYMSYADNGQMNARAKALGY
jgi:TRAP-type mannitol/chloroaromatic compound transport system substrate-binding protein